MFQNSLNPYPNAQLPGGGYAEPIYSRQYNVAFSQFRYALLKGKIFRLKRRALHRPERLYDLGLLKQSLSVRGSSYAGIRVVRIDAIIGSEGRSADFDMNFHPMSSVSHERWINMAIVYLARLPVPPIQLIQVGSAYFVRDGHHRVSVARAFGQAAMDAEVITWNVSSPLPWQPGAAPEAACCMEAADMPA